MFYVFFDFIFFLSFIWFLCGEGRVEAPGERARWCSGRQEKQRKQSFLIARCPSYTAHTTSTRPVFDNLYC